MSDVNIKILSELKSFLEICTNTPDVMDVFRKQRSNFVRKRKLSFENLVVFIVKLCKKTLSVELDHFFEQELKDPLGGCSVSAFSQQRSKLDHLFFQIWNEVLYKSFYHYGREQVKRWRGYRVIAADGSAVSLISTAALSKYFGGQSNPQGAFTGAKAFLQYDMLNKLFIHARFESYRTGELTMAYPAIEQLPADCITIYDRHYCNYKMVALHSWQEQERKFLIRGNESRKMIGAFIKSGLRSQVVNMQATPAAVKGLKLCGFIVSSKTLLNVRLVRVDLPGGAVEVLLTNLWEEEGYETTLFKELYNMRWGVETGINVIKNLLELESFSGLTVQSVTQDFFATIFTSNLASLIINQAEQIPMQTQSDKKKKMGRPKTRNWPTKINVNKATGKLRENIVALFSHTQPEQILQHLYAYFKKHQLPIREGRASPRKRRSIQTYCKHRTYPNYKRAT
jgi:hypothetical protein